MESHNHYTAMPVPLANAISEVVNHVEKATKKIVAYVDVTIEGCSFHTVRLEFVRPGRHANSSCLPEDVGL